MPKIESYDQHYNLCYLSIHPIREEKGFMSSQKTQDSSLTLNIAVYDIDAQTITYLFENLNEAETILDFLFEESYDEQQQAICHNDATRSHKISIQNNKNIVPRALANRIWVLTGGSKKTHKLWSFEKNGQNKRFIAEWDKDTLCRMDVFNQKIRLIRFVGNKVEIQDFDSF